MKKKKIYFIILIIIIFIISINFNILNIKNIINNIPNILNNLIFNKSILPKDENIELLNNDKNYITVITDILNVKINLKGGEISYVSLPTQLVSLNSKKQIILLSEKPYYGANSILQIKNDTSNLLFKSEKNKYFLNNDNKLLVNLHTKIDGINIEKKYIFKRNDYSININYLITNNSNKPINAFLKCELIIDLSNNKNNSYLTTAYSSDNNPYKKISFNDIQKNKFNNYKTKGGWVAIIQHYFLSAWIPNKQDINSYYANMNKPNIINAYFIGPTKKILPMQHEDSFSATLYVGPKIKTKLESIEHNLYLTIDYGKFRFLSNILFYILQKIYKLIGNWGFSIILLTFLVKIILLPLSIKSNNSIIKINNITNSIKQKYSYDIQKMNKEIFNLYKKEKINTLGGILPLIIQMPIFIALYCMLIESYELRQSPFIFWIKDLSVNDPYFILPIIMGISLYLQYKLSIKELNKNYFINILPIIFIFFLLWVPSGLLIYWITNNILTSIQQYYLNKK